MNLTRYSSVLLMKDGGDDVDADRVRNEGSIKDNNQTSNVS